MLKPKVGDMVTLKPMLVRERNQKGFWAGKLDEGYKYFLDEEAVSIEPRALQVGDRVWITADCKAPSDGYRVEFVSDRVALSYNGSLLGRTYPPADLTRVEDKP